MNNRKRSFLPSLLSVVIASGAETTAQAYRSLFQWSPISEGDTAKKAVAYMTVKESKEHGNKFYTLELMLKKISLAIKQGISPKAE